MSLNNQIVAKPRGQVALLEEAQRIMDVVDVMGKKVGKLAVYDPDKFIDLAELVAANKQNPGFFADALLSIRIEDTQGRKRAVLREGKVKRAVIELAQTGDLMKGKKRSDLAKFFGVTPTDKVLDGIIHTIRDICKIHLGLAVGSDGGHLRVLTQQALGKKNQFRAQMMEGLERNGEDDNRVFRAQGMLPECHKVVQLELYNPPPDDERELS